MYTSNQLINALANKKEHLKKHFAYLSSYELWHFIRTP